MVPEGWERKPLEKVAQVRTGVAKGKKGLKDPIEVPYLRVANVQDGHIDLREVKTIQIERHQLDRYSLKKGDVLLTEGGDFDKLGRGDVWDGQIEPCLNQNHVFAVRAKNEVLIPHFLAALSGSNYGKTYFLGCAKRSTNLASINSTQLKEFPVLLPPLPEQQKIARILSTWDKAITNTEKLIDNSKQQKKALIQQLLTGKKRFPGFEGEWEEVSLSDIAKVSIGLVTTMTKYYVDKGIPLIRNSDIKQNTIKKIGMLQLCSDFSSDFENRKLRKGDVVTVHTGDVGVSSVIDDELDGCIGFATLNTRPNTDKVNPNFLSWYFNSQPFINWCVAMSTGDGRQNLNLKDFVKAKILVPCISEQKKVVSVLTNADKEIELLEQQLADLKQEKKALMQQLLTGKRRVKIDEAEVA